MLCRNCYKEVPDGTKFCPECGAPLEGEMTQNAGPTPVQSAAQNTPIQMTPRTPQQIVAKKQSGMSSAAMILAILTCTAPIGLILGIVDLVSKKDDSNTHGGSIFAIIWGGIVTLVVAFIAFVMIGIAPSVSQSLNNTTSETNSSFDVSTGDASTETASEPDGGEITDGVIKTSDYTIKITNYRVIPVGEEGNKYGDAPVLAIWYDTTNTSGKEISPMMAWIPIANAVQDNDPNMVNELNVGMLPDSSFTDSQMANIKEGGTVANAMAYTLSDTTTPVVITFTDGLLGKKIGTITFNLN